MTEHGNSEPLARWGEKVLPHLRAAERVALHAAVIVLIVWFVLGLIFGFVAPGALFGVGGLGAAMRLSGHP